MSINPRRVIIFLILASLATGASAETAAQAPTAEWTRVNLESFDQVWNRIRDQHWDPDMGGLDWDAISVELRPKVEAAKTIDEVRGVLDDMVSRLGLSHYAVIPAEVYERLSPGDGTGELDGWTGIDVRVVDGEALVTSVRESTPAAKAGVRTGWVIRRIGDDDIAAIVKEVAKEFADTGYEDLARASVVLTRLSGPVGEAVRLGLRDGGGDALEVELAFVERPGKKVRLGYLPPIHVWFEHEVLEPAIGYIAFNMFVDPGRIMPVFNEAMESFLDADGVIIDVRGNPGGLPPMAMGMAGWLISEKDRRLGTMITRETRLNVVVLPRPVTYDGPVAVLIDGLSGSCSEIFAGGLKDLGRARIFGSRTMGAALPSAIEKLPNGDTFQYAFANYISEGGEVLEGVGVAPHVEIGPSRDALLEGRDPALEAAVLWIREQKQGGFETEGGSGS